MSIDTMKQALEALDGVADWVNTRTREHPWDQWQRVEPAMNTLRAAIEQAEKQEPYGYFRYDIRLDAWVQNRESDKGVPLYTAPPQRQPHELLCVCGASWSIDGEGNEELLSTPPQRQPLTDAEIKAVIRAGEYDTMEEFARAIERAHGIGGEHE